MTVRSSDHRLFSVRARRQDGFTLIELLVVIVILGVLAAIVVFSVRGIGDKGRKNAIAADAATLRTAEEANCAKFGKYGTVDELIQNGLLASEPVYNAVGLGGGGGKCGSFTVNDTSTPTTLAADIPVGPAPSDLAVDEQAKRVYVATSGDNTVTVIDGENDTAIGSIDVSRDGGVTSPTRVAVNPATKQVYVGGTGGVAVIDTTNNTVRPVSGFTAPVAGLAVSPENGDVYVGGDDGSSVAYIPAGGTSATPITLPAPGVVSSSQGMDFAFDAAHHAVYLAKTNAGSGTSLAASIGVFAISSQTHTAANNVLAQSATKSSCGTNAGNVLLTNSARGVAVDPNRNLVYFLARRCVPNPLNPTGAWKTVATTIVINPADGSSTPIDDPVGTPYAPDAVVYNPAAGSVYVYLDGGASCGGSGGRIDRIVGASVTGQIPVCGVSTAPGNLAHKITALRNFNRVFAAQQSGSGAPGGIGPVDGGTLLPQPSLGTPRQFGALATNNATAKVYAVDAGDPTASPPVSATVAVFRTGSA